MSLKLSDDDRRVIDLLLDPPTSAASDTPALTQVFTSPHPDQFESRLEAAEKVLALLDNDPASDPPTDLVSRTLARIEESVSMPGTATMPGATRTAGTQQRPHA